MQLKKNSSLFICRYVFTPQTVHESFLILFQMFLLPNFNFLINKQNKTPNIDPKMSKQKAGIAILRRALPFTQANRVL